MKNKLLCLTCGHRPDYMVKVRNRKGKCWYYIKCNNCTRRTKVYKYKILAEIAWELGRVFY